MAKKVEVKQPIEEITKGDCPTIGCNASVFKVKSIAFKHLKDIEKSDEVESVFCTQCGRQLTEVEYKK